MTIVILKSDIDYKYKNAEDLKQCLEKEYSFFGYKPDIIITDKFVQLTVDDKVFESTGADLQKAFDFCNKQQFDKAEPLLKKVVEICPLQADAFRTLAQIHMQQGDLDTAINYNIEALKADPGNLWALVLMGNIFVRKGDVDTADIYYNKVLEYHPNDGIALNNVGSNYLQRRNFDKAIELFNKALEADSTYLNSYLGLLVAYQEKGDLDKAFEFILKGVKNGTERQENPLTRNQCLSQLSEVAQAIVKVTDYMPLVQKFTEQLEQKGKKMIKFEKDNTLKLMACLQYATTHQRPFHKVIYNSQKPIYSHYLMHELTHLQMNIEASELGANFVVFHSKKVSDAFNRKYGSAFNKLIKKIGSAQVETFKSQMHDGLALQLMNCPLDLLVEDRIFRNHPDMKPLQFMSLFDQETTNIKSVEEATKSTDIPYDIVRQNKVMNIVTSMHFKELFGIDLVHYYKPTKADLTLAEDLYEEYKAYRDDYKPGEEYTLMSYFIEQLGSVDLVSLENEDDFTKRFGLISDEKADTIEPKTEKDKKELTTEFQQNHKDGANPTETMMMSMYMLGALQFLSEKSNSEIGKIAVEIAMVGLNGINPNKQGYKIPSIDKEFGGYEFLAFYYVSWALYKPEMLEKLGLPFKTAYETALQMFNKEK